MIHTQKDRLLALAKADMDAAYDNLCRANIAARGRDTSEMWGQSGQSLQSIIDGYREWYEQAKEIVESLGGTTKAEPMFTREG